MDEIAQMDILKSTFDNLQLNQQAQYLGLENERRSKSDSPRPKKRQKLIVDQASDPSKKILNEMIGNFQHLLGSQAAEDLDGLENLAV